VIRSVTQYLVLITPKTGTDTYGTELDVSNKVLASGISNIKMGADSGDYGFGIFAFGDITLKAFNKDGFFNDESDIRSMFQFSRDEAKVKIQWQKITWDDVLDILTVTPTQTFKGFIDDDATRVDATNGRIRFKVLSEDAVLRKSKVPGGVIGNGVTASTALGVILDTASVTKLLTFNAANINPAFDFTIDVGSEFDGKLRSRAVKDILLASNSVMIVDSDSNIIVQSRSEDQTANILSLFGEFDIQGRSNIKSLRAFNSGRHRMFNTIKVNTEESVDTPIATQFGARRRDISLSFVTSVPTAKTIADTLLESY